MTELGTNSSPWSLWHKGSYTRSWWWCHNFKVWTEVILPKNHIPQSVHKLIYTRPHDDDVITLEAMVMVMVTVTVTVTVTVDSFECPKNKRPRGLPLDIRSWVYQCRPPSAHMKQDRLVPPVHSAYPRNTWIDVANLFACMCKQDHSAQEKDIYTYRSGPRIRHIGTHTHAHIHIHAIAFIKTHTSAHTLWVTLTVALTYDPVLYHTSSFASKFINYIVTFRLGRVHLCEKDGAVI